MSEPTSKSRLEPKCDRLDFRLIPPVHRADCRSETRTKPVPMISNEPERFKDYCCSPDYSQCPFYSERKL
jgi:hypothetical protein